MTSCNKIMCKYNLNNKTDTKKWLLKNHPDKNNNIQHPDHVNITECYKNNKFCNLGNTNKQKNTITKKNRNKIFKCMRKVANFGKINNYHKFDKSSFDVETLNEKNLNDVSPKMSQLLNNIIALDKQDKENHGKTFKHFIFSDVKDGGYGAKIIASSLIAAGYNNILKARKVKGVQKMKLYLNLANSDKNFGILASNSLYGSAINERLKRELLNLYNSRPDNINGEKLRFIIFDSGFKEGIDLFDVKYVHIFEPSMTIADLKQTIGRATRTCGQKGLDFQPGIGWPLYVYNYFLTIPESVNETFNVSKNLIENTPREKDEDILLFKNVEKFNDASMKYSEFDKAMNNLSAQLYNLGPVLSVDYILTNNLHNVEDLNEELMNKDFLLRGGAPKYNSYNKLLKKTNTNSKFFNVKSINCQGNCGKTTTYDVPVSLDFMKRVYKKYGFSNKLIPKTNQRVFFCTFLKTNKKYCDVLNKEWALRFSFVPSIIEKNKKENIKKQLLELELNFNPENNKLHNTPVSKENSIDNDEDDIYKDYELLNYTGIKQDKFTSKKLNNKLAFNQMRNYIKSEYNTDKYKWKKIVIENKCISKTNKEKTSDKPRVEFNCTQNFIMDYFTPDSPYKGILAWHSVGTGKTCTGIATASSSFEKAGYTILWVTRTTLKSDVWKNMFDQICNTTLQKDIDNGLILPDKLNERKKLLSERWLEPMSYKQFSNLLSGKNKIYNILRERNGEEDILKKTLIIIDEAHKLYGGDLKATERPNTDVMEKLIMNSYKKSQKNSCKLLIMTATPFTNTPLELFNLTNLFQTSEEEKITTDKDEFIKQYMNKDNILSENGIKSIANKLSGYISYLNRERDATQFSQPIMIDVPVLLSHIKGDEIRDIIYLNKKIESTGKKYNETIHKLNQQIKVLKEQIKTKKDELVNDKKNIKKKCDESFPGKKNKSLHKDCIESAKEELDELENLIKELVQELDNLNNELTNLKNNKEKQGYDTTKLKERVKLMKKSLVQDYMLFKKCENIIYKSRGIKDITPETRKVKSLSLKKSKNINKTKKFKSI